MPLIFFASPKGGVGKTTMASNIAVAMRRVGWRVIAIDFDRQNAMRLHFGISPSEKRGFAKDVQASDAGMREVHDTASGVRVMPFGALGATQANKLERNLEAHPGWLAERVARLVDTPRTLVIADTPPGYSVYASELDKIAAFKVVLLLADAASFSVLPPAEDGKVRVPAGEAGVAPVFYLVNQVDYRRRLNRGVLDVLRQLLGNALLGIVHADEAFAEALAFQQPVMDYAPASVAAYDIEQLARSIHQMIEGSAPARRAAR
jgi:cellulose synthase operon protein YhjQ